ncbi:MAG: hypothetical protein CVV44_21250 [Spirochaetae bacterium HGW-Spirochaetae-1]|jgi:hypothetical protein|nr:MAG: hypothetical protein CVV44_21250 [Spirochaetae bacterium HGW-Spirochaetae-1]
MIKNNMKFIYVLLILIIITPALDAADQPEKPITRDYHSIKKEQAKDYRSGVDESEKDRVKEWFTEDIDYYERLIKLKSDYRDWAMDKINENQEVKFSAYTDGKNFTAKEKEILYDYHLRLFSRGNAEKVVKRPGKKRSRAIVPVVKEKEQGMPLDFPVPNSRNNENKKTFHGIMLPTAIGAALAIMFGIAVIAMKKRKAGNN